MNPAGAEAGPWNPGIKSRLPAAYLPLSTMFRPENVFNSSTDALDLSDLTGLAPEVLAAFRPERLAVHEVLVRVTADLSVPDGSRYADLGINFRRMTERILTRYIDPHMTAIARAYDAMKQEAAAIIERRLSAGLPPPLPQAAPTGGRLARLFRPSPGSVPQNAPQNIEDAERRMAAEWRRAADQADGKLEKTALLMLIRVADSIRGRHGRLRGDTALLTMLAVNLTCNDHGSEMIGDMIEPHIRRAAGAENYRYLPLQDRPVVMNVKGASASGKSTMRPLQHALAEELGIEWSDFALMSPDIWRKYLLDYDSLGVAAKYAGALTAHEVELIDRKLDRHMRRKAEAGNVPHLLIDRFRFDSFAAEPDEEEGSNLLTRFGDLVYLFFMITPPDATVERAWKRGLKFGRYKAVDDLLDHNVEAFTGMPRLFFTWALKPGKSVHYEFLDNSVAEGTKPRTVAFGLNGDMNILDIKCMLDVDRYRKIHIGAKRPKDVYPGGDAMAAGNNTGFLRQCARMIPAIAFADHRTGRVYARLQGGKLDWTDGEALAQAMEDPDTRAGLAALAPEADLSALRGHPKPEYLDPGHAHTLGRWGEAG